MSQDAIDAALHGTGDGAPERVRQGVIQAAHGLNLACMQGLPGAPLPVLRRIGRLLILTNRVSYLLHQGDRL